LESGEAAALPVTGVNLSNGKSGIVVGARVTMDPGLRRGDGRENVGSRRLFGRSPIK
jgi:hypothetical protein